MAGIDRSGGGNPEGVPWAGEGARTARVCPDCRKPAGSGSFCEQCGRDLSAIDAGPAREEAHPSRGALSGPEQSADEAEIAADEHQKVCPTCGFEAEGIICQGCGTNLSYTRLVTRTEWNQRHTEAVVAQNLSRAADEVIVATTNELPGYRVVEVYGEVFGLTARARNMFANWAAGVRTVVGGEARSYTTLLIDSRVEAVDRLKEAAAERGANAVLAMRFDANEIHDVISEIVAYGTAVKVERAPSVHRDE